MAELGFSVNPAEEESGFYAGKHIFPPGWHKFVLTNEEVKGTSSGGKALVFTYANEAGQTLDTWLNLWHAKENVRAVARGELSKLALAIGHSGTITSTDILFGRPFEVLLEVIDNEWKDKATGETKTGKQNKIKDYRKIQQGQPTVPDQGSQQQNQNNPWV